MVYRTVNEKVPTVYYLDVYPHRISKAKSVESPHMSDCEEGYEDSAYDHGKYDKHGEHHEVAPGWEMTAVRLAGQAAKSHPERGSNEEEGGEEEDDDDHNAEGSNPKVKAVAAPDLNSHHHGTTNETRGTWRFQNVLADDKKEVGVADFKGNITKPTQFATFPSLPTVMESKRDSGSNLLGSTHKPFNQEQLQIETLLRAFKLKEKNNRLAQKRSKKWGREKKKTNLLSKNLKKGRKLSLDGFDIGENEIKQPRSRKEKKVRKEQKRSKRMKALTGKRKKSLITAGLSGDVKQVNLSSKSLSRLQIMRIPPVHVTNATNGTDRGLLMTQETTDGASKLAKPLKSVLKNPFSRYHRDPPKAVASVSSIEGVSKDVLGQSSVEDANHPKLWKLVSPWESYGNGKEIPSVQSDSLFRPLPLGLLAITDNAEVGNNDGLATVFQPILNTMEGFLETTGGIGGWVGQRDPHVVDNLEKRSLNTTLEKPKFVLPGQGNALGKFPKTEAILQMETRTLSKLRKTHNVTELPSNIKHVKPLIGVSSSKGGKLTAKQIKTIKDIGKRSNLNYQKDSTEWNRDGLFPTAPTFDDFAQSSTETKTVTKDRSVYIANLTENYLTMKNFSWPPQVILSSPTERKIPLGISQQGQKPANFLPENMLHRKIRRNVGYQTQTKPHKNVHRGIGKFKRDNKPTSFERSSELRIDEKKYPFYFATPSIHLTRYSPLRYASNPLEIPAKTGGGMEFYESREKYKRCKEVEPPEDPIPDRTSDGQWVQNKDGPDGPRISGLGEVISCLREKLFGKDPLDNPFFLETKVGLPADTSMAATLNDDDGSPAPEKDDHFEFYKDIMGHIEKTALKPFRSTVPDNPYVYMGSKSVSDAEDAHLSPAHYAAPHYSHLNLLHTIGKPKTNLFDAWKNIPQKLPSSQLKPKDVRENGQKSERLDPWKDTMLQEPPINQQYFKPLVPVHDTTVDPHTPFKISENSKKYLDKFLDDLVKRNVSKEGLSPDRSQTDAQETNLRIAHSDSIYQPAVSTKMHPPPLSILKYKSIYANNPNPYTRLGPNSHEKLLSWPKAKYVLRDIGAKQEVFESSESKDPLRSQIESNPGKTVHERKKIISTETIVHSTSFNYDQPFSAQNPKTPLHPSKTSEIAKQQHVATKEPEPVTVKIQTTTPSGKSVIESIRKDVHEPSASVITPLSTSYPPRLPEPIYHTVRGVGGIKSYHVGMQDDSVIEIPTPTPDGNKWSYKPEEHTEGTEVSAQQSGEGEQQASNEPEAHEEEVPVDDNNAENESKNDDDDHKDEGNAKGPDNDDDNASPDKNEDNDASDANKHDNESDAKQHDDNKSDAPNDDDKGEDDAAKPEENEAPENDDNNKSDAHNDEDKDKGDDDVVKPEENEAPENDDNENEDDKSNNNGKPDFDDWFKESPYKVDDKDDYNVDWDDSRPKIRVPFSKEWHKELGGINDEFKDDNDNDEDGVGKHVEKLFDDDKGHDAYPDINTEPPAPASGEEGPGDGNEAENKEASQQDPQQDTSAQNAPSDEDNKAASPEKGQASATEEEAEDVKQSPKEEDDGSNAAEENISPEENEQKPKKRDSEEPNSQEEPVSAEQPKKWESSEPARPSKKSLKDESAQEAPSLESGGTGNDDGYDPAGYEKPGDRQEQSDEAGTEESQQSPKKAKVDEFWTDKDDFEAPPGAKIRVVEHDASFGDMDDFNDDDDLSSQGGRKTTRRGKNPDNLSITTTNSQVRSKGFDTGINKRRATSHQKKARPSEENTDTTSSGEDMDADFATNPKIEVPHPDHGNNTLINPTNVTTVKPSPLP